MQATANHTAALSEGRMIGNRALRQQLAVEIRQGTLTHAYLIEGAAGMGKHLLARELCAAMSCQNRAGALPLPCGGCPSCEKILNGKSPDVTVIGRQEDRVTIGVDDVRFLRADVLVPPNDLDHRFYIIEDAHTLTPQAQNALLLTLEEPPAYVVLLLLCENSANILETVRSRAPSLRLCPVADAELDAHLSKTQRAYTMLEEKDRKELLCMAAGSTGRALELLDGRARKPLIEKRRFVERAVETILSTERKDTVRTLELLGGFGTVRDEVISRLVLLQQALRDLMLLKYSEEVSLLFFADREEAMQLSQKTTVATLHLAQQRVADTRERALHNANLKLALSELLLCDDDAFARQLRHGEFL